MTELIISIGSFLVSLGVLVAMVIGMFGPEEFADDPSEDNRKEADRRG